MLRTAASLVILTAAACDRAPARSPTDPTASRPPANRTIDNTGYIDNGGRSSDMRARTEMSGMRATEAASEPAGTPGAGLPLPIEASPRKAQSAPAPVRSATRGVPASAVVGRLAQAVCDQEQACGQATSGKCLETQRPAVRGAVDRAGCGDDFDPDAVTSCLAAIRRGTCGSKMTAHAACADLCIAR